MATNIFLSREHINQLDISPARTVVDSWLENGAIASQSQQLRFDINYPQEPTDPRELSEIPEIRLWFIRLDSYYPWLPIALDWEVGELGRYAAMLVPHQFSSTEGIQYNPEALEIFVMQKVFTITHWAQQHGISSRNRLKMMTKVLGYELEDSLFDVLNE
ncbi:MAG: CRR6 family NdhI maturation factor [Elainellaceae cyanobacterium]